MVLEIADLSIVDGKNAEFEKAIEAGVREVISKAKGFKNFRVQKGVENPNRYLLMIEWETLENHMVDFRGSPEFGIWRSYVGPFFEKPPAMEHFQLIID